MLQGDGEVRKREDLRRRQTKPTTTLFVVNFDVDKTRERDLEEHFEPFGKLRRVQIKRNYAFIQYENVDQSSDAQKACHGTCLRGAPHYTSILHRLLLTPHACTLWSSSFEPSQYSKMYQADMIFAAGQA